MKGTQDDSPIPGHPDLEQIDDAGPRSDPRIPRGLLDGAWLLDHPETQRESVGSILNGGVLSVQDKTGRAITLVRGQDGKGFTEYWKDSDGHAHVTPNVVITGTSITPNAGFREGEPEVTQYGYLHRGIVLTFRAGEADRALGSFEQSDRDELSRWIDGWTSNPEDIDNLERLETNQKIGLVVNGDDGRLYWRLHIPLVSFGPIESFTITNPEQE